MSVLALGMRHVSAQEAQDPFKTEIFLTPYSKLGSGQGDYPRLSGQFLLLSEYTNYFGVKDDKGQIPNSHWISAQPKVDSALLWHLTQALSIRSNRSEEYTSELQSLMRIT